MKKTILLLGLIAMFSCSQSQKAISESAMLIENVNIVDVRTGQIDQNKQVVVDSGRIVSITEDVDAPELYKSRVDGTGQYLLPGLSEMHAHIPSPHTSQTRIEETLFLYLSNGITTIRGMLGHPAHLDLRERAANGELLSPRIITSSPSLNGNTVQTEEEARSKVEAYAADGYDFLKIHPGIQRDVFEVLAATAKTENIEFAGHVPVDVGIVRALELEYATIDHVDGFLEGLVPEASIEDPSAKYRILIHQ